MYDDFCRSRTKLQIGKLTGYTLCFQLLQDIICKEQTEFLEFARSKWDKTAILFMKCPGFVKSKWAMKMHRVQELPKYFTECANIPFSGNNDIRLKFVCSLQEVSHHTDDDYS